MPTYKARSYLKVNLFLIFSLITTVTFGQISHGGSPLPISANVGARQLGQTNDMFVEMPSFDIQSAIRNSQLDQGNLKSLEFAHKFMVHLRPDNSGILFNSSGMEVWRVGIRSRKAYSVNILFTKFRLPEGAKLFVYNSNQTEVLGSYTSANNSDLNLLPVQPIGGEELIVEYQVPIGSSDKGEIEIGEVNHDFLGVFRATEPRDPLQSCHPNIICYPEDIEPGSGVVALIINGTTFCTGSLINNTAEDGTPYLLTATHCLNMSNRDNFIENRKYGVIAGSIVAFFNYQSPICDKPIRGPLQMTMSSADSILISERYDISLLKFREDVPIEYQPYFLGWNSSSNSGSSQLSPFHGIHHPNGGIKKTAIENDGLIFGSFNAGNYNVETEPNAFWIVREWDVAATEPGSSGSPLVDTEKRIIGTLTGGASECGFPKGPDQYSSLYKFWNVEGSIDNPHSLRYYLDPAGTGTTRLNGYNPYEEQPYKRSQNYSAEETSTMSYFQSVPMFSTNNTFGYTEFAEEFYAKRSVKLNGVFISSPAIANIANMDIRIRVYTGEDNPKQILHEQDYNYSYLYYSGLDNFTLEERNMKYSLENYIEFDNPVTVSGSFYIAYLDNNNTPLGFTALNTEPRKPGSEIASTTWMKNSTGWVRTSENLESPMNTSLLISPYTIGDESIIAEPDRNDFELKVYHSKEVQRIIIDSNRDLLQWEIFYSSGVKVHQEETEISINRASFPAAHLPRGIYIVRVRTVDGTSVTKKVLVM